MLTAHKQRLDKASYSGGALLLKKVNFKVIFKIPGGHIAMFSTKAVVNLRQIYPKPLFYPRISNDQDKYRIEVSVIRPREVLYLIEQ